MCLDNISKYFIIVSMKKTGFIRRVHVLSFAYYVIDTKDILNIHGYLMKITKIQIKIMFGFI